MLIEPTLGRSILYRPKFSGYDEDTRQAAIIAKVNYDGTINIATFNEFGVAENEQNVVIVQGDAVPEAGQCEWMAYQKGQAAKTADDLHARILRLETIVSVDCDIPLPELLSVEMQEAPQKHDSEDIAEVVMNAEDNEVVTGDDLVAAPDGTDESTDHELSEDDVTGDDIEAPLNGMTVTQIAEACHEANRSYCEGLGDDSQLPWEDAPEWQKESAINGVLHVIANPDALPSDSHESWLAEKLADGWVYGEEKDAELKTHPCILPYDELPEEQRKKDELFIATVRGCLGAEVQDVAV